MVLKPRPKAVVFDFNGTLLDDLLVAYGSVGAIFRHFSLPCPSIEQYKEEITSDYMKFYYDHGIPETAIANELNNVRNDFYLRHGHSVKIRPDVWRIVRLLFCSNIRVAIVSADTAVNLYRYLVRNNLQREFDFIRAEAWDGKDRALLQVAEIFEVYPEDMIYVDDTVDGMNAAKKAGVVPVAFANPTGYNSKERLLAASELSVSDMNDLIGLLNV